MALPLPPLHPYDNSLCIRAAAGPFSQHCIYTATPSAFVLLLVLLPNTASSSHYVALCYCMTASPPFLLLKWILYHPHLLPEINKLSTSKSLGKDVCRLFSCRSVAQLYSFSLETVSDKVTSNINVLWLIMKYWILRELDATLIITHDAGRLHPSSK